MSRRKVVPVVLVGGSGERLWPWSRKSGPKPFLKMDILGRKTLFGNTLDRLRHFTDFESPIIVGNHQHSADIVVQLFDRQFMGFRDRMLLEPWGRGTALAIGVAAQAAKKIYDTDELHLLVLPSDHHIRNNEIFASSVREAIPEADAGKLVCFGVHPTDVNINYGYIVPEESTKVTEKGRWIHSFVEKPESKEAYRLIQMGALWNSGMFMFPMDVLLEEFETISPIVLSAAEAAYSKSHKGFPGVCLCRQTYENLPISLAQSIDVEIMEKTTTGAVLPVGDMGWTDLGTWEAVAEVSRNPNVRERISVSKGNLLQQDSKNIHVHGRKNRKVVVLGMEDCVIVDTKDVLLVMHKNTPMDQFKLFLDKLKGMDHKSIL